MDKKYGLRKLIQRAYDNIPCETDSERAAVTVRIFGVEDEVNLSELGSYRKADIVSVIESAFENREKRMLANVPDNLEQIVDKKPVKTKQQEIIKGSIVYELIKHYAKAIPRHIFFGALPRKTQEKLAKKYGDDEVDYTKTNIVIEAMANTGLIISLGYSSTPEGIVSAIFLGFYTVVSTMFRSIVAFGDDDPIGAVPVAIPYRIMDSLFSGFKIKYLEKKEELKNKLELEQKESAKLEQKKTHAFPYNHLEALGFEKIKPYIPEKIESSETKQLPPISSKGTPE